MGPKTTPPSTTHVVSGERFKIIHVPTRTSIRDFVKKQGVTFAPGRGFYQLSKPETIQTYKEIVAVRKSDNAQVSGPKVRELLKIPDGVSKFKYTAVPDYDIYVQSTSYNRVLVPGTNFLYEISPSSSSSAASIKKRANLAKESRGPPPSNKPAGSPIDLVFSFDTTGSMYSCLGEVRKNLETMINRILTDIPNIRIAVFAHGDYCDRSNYVTSYIDFTTDKKKLVDFVRNIASTGGGDWPECYELVLKEVREKLSWISEAQKALVMIGDAIPHYKANYASIMKTYSFVTQAIDWREECDNLLNLGCRIYAVQCSSTSSAEVDTFWGAMAYKTYGHHLSLSSFSNVFDFIMAIAYREQGAEQLEAYRQEVIKRTPGGSGLNSELHALFDALAAGDEADMEADDNTDTDIFGSGVATTSAAAPKASGTKRKASSPAKSAPAKKAAPARGAAKKTAPARGAAKKTMPARGAAKKTMPARGAAKKTTPARGAAKKTTPARGAVKKTTAKGADKKAALAKTAARKGKTTTTPASAKAKAAVAGKTKAKAVSASKTTAKKPSVTTGKKSAAVKPRAKRTAATKKPTVSRAKPSATAGRKRSAPTAAKSSPKKRAVTTSTKRGAASKK